MKKCEEDDEPLYEPQPGDNAEFEDKPEIYRLISLAFCILENLVKFTDYK